MKKLMITAAALASLCASAATVDELNKIPVKDVTVANAEEVFDAAVVLTNCAKITAMVAQGKISLEDAVHKTVGKKPDTMTLAAFNGAPNATNYTLQAEVCAGYDYAVVDSGVVRSILLRHRFATTEVGKAEVARAYAANKLLGAEIYCSTWNVAYRTAFAQFSDEAYEAAKPLVKTQANSRQASVIWWYCFNRAHDYDSFPAMYDKTLLDLNYDWLLNTTTRPQYKQYMNDMLEAYKARKPSVKNDAKIIRASKVLDKVYENKSTTLAAVDSLSCSKSKLDAALYCNDMDKVLEVLVACDTTLEAKDIEAALGPINALDPDYKPAEVLKALKAVNQRYTLKLYDDRDAWEPVLSKIRAMIDCR